MSPWTGACQTSLFMEFSRQEYWSELPFLSPGDLSNPGIKAGSPVLPADSLPSEQPGINILKQNKTKQRIGRPSEGKALCLGIGRGSRAGGVR